MDRLCIKIVVKEININRKNLEKYLLKETKNIKVYYRANKKLIESYSQLISNQYRNFLDRVVERFIDKMI